MNCQDDSHGTPDVPAARNIPDTLPVLKAPQGMRLPDTDQWTNRFKIHSQTSNRVYTIAQHKKKRHWGCSCPKWRTLRRCKHLEEIGLPTHERPYEAKLDGGQG